MKEIHKKSGKFRRNGIFAKTAETFMNGANLREHSCVGETGRLY